MSERKSKLAFLPKERELAIERYRAQLKKQTGSLSTAQTISGETVNSVRILNATINVYCIVHVCMKHEIVLMALMYEINSRNIFNDLFSHEACGDKIFVSESELSGCYIVLS